MKLTVALPREALTVVELVAIRSGKTKTQVLREAIACYEFVDAIMQDPDRSLWVCGETGAFREITFTDPAPFNPPA